MILDIVKILSAAAPIVASIVGDDKPEYIERRREPEVVVKEVPTNTTTNTLTNTNSNNTNINITINNIFTNYEKETVKETQKFQEDIIKSIMCSNNRYVL